ncbi:uncharacterized protein LOC130703328 [Daphnia carinata]|uniref:uncharacterized protein LOC130703328 n=1 Tax=Daphnia carinata TaxID=120202 RepID=UPI00257D318D|nr:uncharacterized protein LOC130703328 [Daphnia carinata]
MAKIISSILVLLTYSAIGLRTAPMYQHIGIALNPATYPVAPSDEGYITDPSIISSQFAALNLIKQQNIYCVLNFPVCLISTNTSRIMEWPFHQQIHIIGTPYTFNHIVPTVPTMLLPTSNVGLFKLPGFIERADTSL